MGLLSGITDFVGSAVKSVTGFLSGGVGDLIGGVLGAKGAADTNSANTANMREQMAFNEREAQKTRDFQTAQRETQYQTAVKDMMAAGLNPMLAYSQGGAGTTSGATASSGSLPQMLNKMQSAIGTTAAAAQIENTNADTQVKKATADQVKAQTELTMASTGNVSQQTQNLKEAVSQIKQNVQLQTEQTRSEIDRRVLLRSQAALTDVERMVEEKRITLVQAQEMVQRITAKLTTLEIPGATNKANSEGTWWGRNVRPFLGDVGSVTNSAGSISRLRK